MVETHVISALVAKRSELAGELMAAEQRIAKIQADLSVIDGAIKIFDPAAVPGRIRPRKPSSPPLTPLPHGQASRVILAILREATEPMTSRQIADAFAAQCGMVNPSKALRKGLMTKVRNALARQHGRGITNELRGETLHWRVG